MAPMVVSDQIPEAAHTKLSFRNIIVELILLDMFTVTLSLGRQVPVTVGLLELV